jgi:hypothetical protein
VQIRRFATVPILLGALWSGAACSDDDDAPEVSAEVGAFCTTVSELRDSDTASLDQADPASLARSIDESIATLERLIDEAPEDDELEAALSAARDGAAEVAEKVDATDLSDTAATAALLRDLEAQSDQLTEAQQAVDLWFTDNNCVAADS